MASTVAEETTDCELALVILEPYFEAARERFLEFSEARGLESKKLARTRLECGLDMHDTPRHFAGAAEDGSRIRVAPQIVDLPEDTVAAILAHEFGHILDHLNPGRFVLQADEESLLFIGDIEEDVQRADKVRLARIRQWRSRNEHSVELVADLIAAEVIGKRIGYSGPCLLQGFGRGIPRPASLR